MLYTFSKRDIYIIERLPCRGVKTAETWSEIKGRNYRYYILFACSSDTIKSHYL